MTAFQSDQNFKNNKYIIIIIINNDILLYSVKCLLKNLHISGENLLLKQKFTLLVLVSEHIAMMLCKISACCVFRGIIFDKFLIILPG